MKEEIFGPLLPIVPYTDIQKAVEFINARPNPLTLYIYTKDRKIQDYVIDNTLSGSVLVNDSLIHWSSPYFPVGGIGNSGMGNYHGKYGFDTFSLQRGIVRKSLLVDPFFRYPPYTKIKEKLLKLVK
jgi:aldehyde dehydrogenase (NAD+)